MNTTKTNPAILDIEAVLALFDFADYDNESNWEYLEESALFSYAYRHDLEFNPRAWELTQKCESCEGIGIEDDGNECLICKGEGKIELDIDEIRQSDEYEKYYEDVESPFYKAWLNALETTLDRYLEYHDLKAERIKIPSSYESQGKTVRFKYDAYQIKPVSTWKKACESLVETINGYGYFQFNSAWEFVQHGPIALINMPCWNICTRLQIMLRSIALNRLNVFLRANINPILAIFKRCYLGTFCYTPDKCS